VEKFVGFTTRVGTVNDSATKETGVFLLPFFDFARFAVTVRVCVLFLLPTLSTLCG
jgi:hypothetical protein